MIRSKICIPTLLFGLLLAFDAGALTVFECVDNEGDSSFRDGCPPGMSLKSKIEFRGEPEPEEPPSAAEIARDNPVTLFVAPNCNACDLVRNMLESRNIPFDEKDASEDPEVQAELSIVTEGPLTVPTLTIGESIKLTDYNKAALESALSQRRVSLIVVPEMSQHPTPEAAETAFYDAFARGDFELMMSLWAPDDRVVCVHPLGPRLADRDTIAASWRQILSAGAPRNFTLEVNSTWESDGLAVRMLDEVISVPGSDAQFRPVIATNVYRRIDGDWFIVEHHASIDASDPPQQDTAAATRH